MGVILEINAGAMAGKKVAIVTGQTVTFGRAAGRAQFALPHDTFMSGVHFAVECGTSGCRVQDRKSSNGTFLNGARIQDAMLANGDEIKSGQTIFSVKIVADAKLASLPPAQDVAPPASQPSASASPAAPRSASQQQPRAAEPELPSSRPAVRPAEEPKVAPPNFASAARPAVRDPIAGPEPPRAARSPSSPVAEPGPVEAAPELSQSQRPRVSGPEVGEPPGFRGVPSQPSVSVNSPRAAEEQRGANAKPARGAEPPPGVAPHIAEKFGDRPASRSAMPPRGFAFSVMGWSFPAAPAEWQVQEGYGLQQSGHEEFPGSVAASEELLGGITLQQFVESQISTLRGYLRDPKIEPTMPPRVGGADESMAVDIRHSTKDGRELVYRRIYARSGASVGVLTVTTLAADFPQVLQTLQPLLDGAAFHASANG